MAVTHKIKLDQTRKHRRHFARAFACDTTTIMRPAMVLKHHAGLTLHAFRETNMARPSIPLVERFWAKVDKSSGQNGCWTWTASTDHDGYGQIGNGSGRMVKAHRTSWELHNGPIPDGLHCLHRCDNPPCCNPSHLFLGTNADNMRDCAAKGRCLAQAHPERAARGASHGHVKLTEDAVTSIRERAERGEAQRAIGRELGVGQSAISKIVRRVNWKHVETNFRK